MGDISDDRSLVLFGRDFAKVPCFRNSFLYGISGGIACGLIRFMFTSRPKSGADFAVGSCVIITLSYWFHCRYQYSKARLEMNKMRYLLTQHTLFEGTETEQEIENETKSKAVDV